LAGLVVLILGNIAFRVAAERNTPPIGVFTECEWGNAAAPCVVRSGTWSKSRPKQFGRPPSPQLSRCLLRSARSALQRPSVQALSWTPQRKLPHAVRAACRQIINPLGLGTRASYCGLLPLARRFMPGQVVRLSIPARNAEAVAATGKGLFCLRIFKAKARANVCRIDRPVDLASSCNAGGLAEQQMSSKW